MVVGEAQYLRKKKRAEQIYANLKETKEMNKKWNKERRNGKNIRKL